MAADVEDMSTGAEKGKKSAVHCFYFGGVDRGRLVGSSTARDGGIAVKSATPVASRVLGGIGKSVAGCPSHIAGVEGFAASAVTYITSVGWSTASGTSAIVVKGSVIFGSLMGPVSFRVFLKPILITYTTIREGVWSYI